ncbi:MAG: ABC transporter permease [Candidatus Bipolaricaulia bacterium]
MLAYITRRLLLLPLILFGVTLLIFAMLQLLDPYERVSVFIRDPAQIKSGTEHLDRLIKKYGLDDPIPVQYFRWLNELFHGNLGWSETASRPVGDAILHFLPASAELALFAVIPILIGGIWLGTTSAVHQNDPIDQGTRVMAITGWSFPDFVFGLMVLMIFYGVLDWFPPGRLSTEISLVVNSAEFVRYTNMNTIDGILNGNLRVTLDALRHLALPVVTLAYVQWAVLMRVMRSSMLETLRQDYITTARAKGLRENVVINKHARRNALIPAVTISGLLVAGLLNGVVIVETVFNYRGLGRFYANAATQLDIPAVLGFVLFNGILFVVVNLVVDVLYAVIDPRVRLG